MEAHRAHFIVDGGLLKCWSQFAIGVVTVVEQVPIVLRDFNNSVSTPFPELHFLQ